MIRGAHFLIDENLRTLLIGRDSSLIGRVALVLQQASNIHYLGVANGFHDAGSFEPYLLLIDLCHPDAASALAWNTLRLFHNKAMFLALYGVDDLPAMLAAVAGVRMFLERTSSAVEFLHMLEQIPTHESWIPADLLLRLEDHHSPRQTNPDDMQSISMSNTAGLTGRETSILLLLCQGESNRKISTRLGISEQSVKNRLRDIYSKLGVINRTQAVVRAIALGVGSSS